MSLTSEFDKLVSAIKSKVSEANLGGLEKRISESIAGFEAVSKDIAPRMKDVIVRMTEAMIRLASETDELKKTVLAIQIESLKRSYYTYLKTIEQKALWESVNQVWEVLLSVKDIIRKLL